MKDTQKSTYILKHYSITFRYMVIQMESHFTNVVKVEQITTI